MKRAALYALYALACIAGAAWALAYIGNNATSTPGPVDFSQPKWTCNKQSIERELADMVENSWRGKLGARLLYIQGDPIELSRNKDELTCKVTIQLTKGGPETGTFRFVNKDGQQLVGWSPNWGDTSTADTNKSKELMGCFELRNVTWRSEKLVGWWVKVTGEIVNNCTVTARASLRATLKGRPSGNVLEVENWTEHDSLEPREVRPFSRNIHLDDREGERDFSSDLKITKVEERG